jgi:hypothetical protein
MSDIAPWNLLRQRLATAERSCRTARIVATPVLRRAPLLAGLCLVLPILACNTDTAALTSPATEPLSIQPAPSQQLPILRISTVNGAPIASKDDYVMGAMSLLDSTGVEVANGTLEIKGRGSTSWDLFPKKSYRLKLGTSTSLVGMPASRHWVLLAEYSDKTMLRNELAFELSRKLGMAWTPRSHYVQVQLNDSYEGVYQLVEHVRIEPNRVNIQALKSSDTSATDITGGYLIEVDERRGEDFCFNSTMTTMVFCVKDPETLLQPSRAKQQAYIVNYLARTDSAIFGPDFADPTKGYAAFIDVESAINYYIVQEIAKNVDGKLRLSAFMYKPRGGKLTFGPVWDFDIAFGNVNYDGADLTDGWFIRDAEWYARLFADPAFAARFRTRWGELQGAGIIESLQRFVTSRANYLSAVQVRNFERWPILGEYVWPNRVVTGSYAGEVSALNSWLNDRTRWMNAETNR